MAAYLRILEALATVFPPVPEPDGCLSQRPRGVEAGSLLAGWQRFDCRPSTGQVVTSVNVPYVDGPARAGTVVEGLLGRPSGCLMIKLMRAEANRIYNVRLAPS